MVSQKFGLQPNQDDIVGVGLRYRHMRNFVRQPKKLGWLEIHPENFFADSLHRDMLKEVAKQYPISFHGVGMSLGSYEPVSLVHLSKMRDLMDYIDPFMVSEHASWSASGNAHANDLLPLPHNQESLDCLCQNIMRAQDFLGRRILIENPSTYLEFVGPMRQDEFIQEAAVKTQCGILLDINNIYVNSVNHGFDAYQYVDNIDPSLVEEVHIAGHCERTIEGSRFLIDTHDSPVAEDVWQLYDYFIQHKGVKLTMLEWDTNLPGYQRLISEAQKIQHYIGDNVVLLRSNVS